MNADDYVNAIKSAFVAIGKKLIVSFILAEVPFLAPLKPLIEHLTGILLTKAANSAEMGAFFLYTDVRVKGQESDFAEAIQKYYLASDEEKAKYEKELINSFERFVKLAA